MRACYNSDCLLFTVMFLFSDVNECLASPCKNGSTCVNKRGSYFCSCQTGFTGKHCEKGMHHIKNSTKLKDCITLSFERKFEDYVFRGATIKILQVFI